MAAEAPEILRAVRAETDFEPEVALLLGSGLDGLLGSVEPVWQTEYARLTGFPRATVAGHEGRLVLGRLGGKRVCVLGGRFHIYEGYSPREVTAGVRLAHGLGARILIVTNAAGSLCPRLAPGTLMAITDHLNLLPRAVPADLPPAALCGPIVAEAGRTDPRSARSAATGAGRADPRSVRAAATRGEAYDAGLRRLLRETALASGLALAEGVYAAVAGPSYETPAEIAFLRRSGAHAVGMSTVPEVLAARDRGLRVAGISCLTNYAAGLARAGLTHADVLEATRRAGPRLERLLVAFLAALPRSA